MNRSIIIGDAILGDFSAEASAQLPVEDRDEFHMAVDAGLEVLDIPEEEARGRYFAARGVIAGAYAAVKAKRISDV